ncbi:prepilin, shufflon protein A [Shigella sonnei]|uniref:prepilin, shufflon protein A n=1 Tax=Shigella sonnei TaxID=624 RepID=UPI0020967F3E|nr:prepilin, shufflon protein A [Shigella sonnei]
MIAKLLPLQLLRGVGLVAIREVVRCLFTPLEGMVVPPGEIVLTHPDCRDTLQGH